ncbi:hypothetical protein SADUNF_Sadunf14G0011000 [Salix dunnii]|uniref:Uncharacterized protein n=1 Tax=Salix dunnii TaxID=1413687 RepID=A0A835MLQ0_9ROSI|nr:hypothetical protein SADUNF_Sadunf14G0011000 [Salix dunnii]
MEKRLIECHMKRDSFMQYLIEEKRGKISETDCCVEKKKNLIQVLLSLQQNEPEYYTDDIIKGFILGHVLSFDLAKWTSYFARGIFAFIASNLKWRARQASAGVQHTGDAREPQQQAAVMRTHPGKINLISCGPMAHVSDIKLIRTDTTLDLSRKAEKGMNWNEPLALILYGCSLLYPCLFSRCGTIKTSGVKDIRPILDEHERAGD